MLAVAEILLFNSCRISISKINWKTELNRQVCLRLNHISNGGSNSTKSIEAIINYTQLLYCCALSLLNRLLAFSFAQTCKHCQVFELKNIKTHRSYHRRTTLFFFYLNDLFTREIILSLIIVQRSISRTFLFSPG